MVFQANDYRKACWMNTYRRLVRATVGSSLIVVGLVGCANPSDSAATTTKPVRQQLPSPLVPATSTTAPALIGTTTTTAPVTGDCATVSNQYVHVSTLSPDAAKQVADACDTSQLTAVIANGLPASMGSNQQAVAYFFNGLTNMICPANPHTKLCP